MRLVDKRFAGIARGVGTANILGRVHSAQLKLTDLHLPCSFTIMEACLSIEIAYYHSPLCQGRDVDLLLGLDMLKGHRACIDLEKNVLRIQGREVAFLSEHELPEKARDPKDFADTSAETHESRMSPTSSNQANQGVLGSPSKTTTPAFPGEGRQLGTTSASNTSPGNTPGPSLQQGRLSSRHPESSIRTLMDLGVSREVAISTLDAAGGSVDVAASLLF